MEFNRVDPSDKSRHLYVCEELREAQIKEQVRELVNEANPDWLEQLFSQAPTEQEQMEEEVLYEKTEETEFYIEFTEVDIVDAIGHVYTTAELVELMELDHRPYSCNDIRVYPKKDAVDKFVAMVLATWATRRKGCKSRASNDLVEIESKEAMTYAIVNAANNKLVDHGIQFHVLGSGNLIKQIKVKSKNASLRSINEYCVDTMLYDINIKAGFGRTRTILFTQCNQNVTRVRIYMLAMKLGIRKTSLIKSVLNHHKHTSMTDIDKANVKKFFDDLAKQLAIPSEIV